MKLTIITTCALALAVTGCGGAQSGQAPQQPPNDCRIYTQENDTRITVAHADKSACDALIQDLSLGGALWRHTTSVPHDGTLGITCDVFKTQYEAVVQGNGEQLSGRDACQMFITQGWTWQQHLGPLAKQLERRQQAVLQAQASQQAAQKRDQQISELQQALTGDISKLAQDAAASENNTSLAADIHATVGTLPTNRASTSGCSMTPALSAPGMWTGCRGTPTWLTGMLTRCRGTSAQLHANPISGDLSAVQRLVSQLRNLEASPATHPSAAVAAGNRARGDLHSAIASAQQQASNLDRTADQVAQEATTLAAQCK